MVKVANERLFHHTAGLSASVCVCVFVHSLLGLGILAARLHFPLGVRNSGRYRGSSRSSFLLAFGKKKVQYEKCVKAKRGVSLAPPHNNDPLLFHGPR